MIDFDRGDVHRAARIAASGHGGQILVSASTAALVGGDLRDLGPHRLKDLSAPERIYQLGADDFPPLKSLHQTNLPIPATPFLGREKELPEVLQLLSLKGIGRWSAEVYLIFALGRPDVWPAADLGLQLAIADRLGLASRPREPELRPLAEAWRPWRSVAACLFWQSYLHARNRTAPLLPEDLYP